MPTINLNKSVFEKLVGKKLPLEELKEKIFYLGTDLESIEGNNITVEIFPNRPDMLSEQGFARAFSSFIGIKTGLREYEVKKSPHRVKVDNSVKDIRPYTACAIIKNLSFNDEKIKEIIQIQEKLHVTFGRNRKKAAIGIYPFEKITPPIYYKAMFPKEIIFRPLDSEKEMTAVEILKNHPAGKEYAHLLENKEKYPVFIDSKNKILSMPPIINSHEVGKITEKTKDIFIECSGFDLNTLKILLNIIVTALSDMGGEVYSMELFYEDKKIITPDLAPSKISLEIEYVNKILGLELKETEIKNLLEKMGYSYKNKHALVPSYRSDILHQIDLVEDIAIAYGYNNFSHEMPNVSTIGSETNFESFKRKIKEALIGFGLLEASSFIIVSNESLKKANLEANSIKIKNPRNKEFDTLRSSLIPSIMQIFSENQHNEFPQKLFEINTVFDYDKEKTNLIIAIAHDKANFTEIKQILDSFLFLFRISYILKPIKNSTFIEGRAGEIITKEPIGIIGEINPEVLTNFNISNPIALLEIDLKLFLR